ncbi:MAG: hypothetical protein M3Q99_09190, partial [Acidobacteriota bacterium]|nr:hypothetical protein [Acidobacteriota bacterium]
FEQSKLSFYSFGVNFVFCRLNHDVREISRLAENADYKLQKKTKFAVWIRVGKTIKHFFI